MFSKNAVYFLIAFHKGVDFEHMQAVLHYDRGGGIQVLKWQLVDLNTSPSDRHFSAPNGNAPTATLSTALYRQPSP